MHQLIELLNEQVKDHELVNPKINKKNMWEIFIRENLLLPHDIQLLLQCKNIEEKLDSKEEI